MKNIKIKETTYGEDNICFVLSDILKEHLKFNVKFIQVEKDFLRISLKYGYKNISMEFVDKEEGVVIFGSFNKLYNHLLKINFFEYILDSKYVYETRENNKVHFEDYLYKKAPDVDRYDLTISINNYDGEYSFNDIQKLF